MRGAALHGEQEASPEAAFRHERVFETRALTCKIQTMQLQRSQEEDRLVGPSPVDAGRLLGLHLALRLGAKARLDLIVLHMRRDRV